MREMMIMIMIKICKWILPASQRRTHSVVILSHLEKMSKAVDLVGDVV